MPLTLETAKSFIIGAIAMPQSPRWLITHGYDEEGLRVIAALAGSSTEDPLVLEQKRMSTYKPYGPTAVSEAHFERFLQFWNR